MPPQLGGLQRGHLDRRQTVRPLHAVDLRHRLAPCPRSERQKRLQVFDQIALLCVAEAEANTRWCVRPRRQGSVRCRRGNRVGAAAAPAAASFGTPSVWFSEGALAIRGTAGCPLRLDRAQSEALCRALEAFLAEFVGDPTRARFVIEA
jgi:hypothetical protein